MKDKDAEDIMQRAVKEIERQVVIDLSARLPYGVKMQVDGDKPFVGTLRRIDYGSAKTLVVDTHVEVMNGSDCVRCLINHTKPYLRTMSSMTEDEFNEFKELEWSGNFEHLSLPLLDWLNKKMFDYRGLIEKGLALEAPKDMYDIK